MFFSRNTSAIFILGLVALQMLLFADQATSSIVHAKKMKKLKKLGAVLLLLKSKSKFYLCLFEIVLFLS